MFRNGFTGAGAGDMHPCPPDLVRGTLISSYHLLKILAGSASLDHQKIVDDSSGENYHNLTTESTLQIQVSECCNIAHIHCYYS